jgi:hypothetical protein
MPPEEEKEQEENEKKERRRRIRGGGRLNFEQQSVQNLSCLPFDVCFCTLFPAVSCLYTATGTSQFYATRTIQREVNGA